jgi:hypothetical protein
MAVGYGKAKIASFSREKLVKISIQTMKLKGV